MEASLIVQKVACQSSQRKRGGYLTASLMKKIRMRYKQE